MKSAFGVDHGDIAKSAFYDEYKRRRNILKISRRAAKDPAYKQYVMNEIGRMQVQNQLKNNPSQPLKGKK